MIEVIPVTTKKQLKQFVDFQINLYRDCPFYVPPLRGDELKLLTEGKSPHLDGSATLQCFLAYKDKKLVGRIAGIIQNLYNEKHNSKRVRFSRVDFVDDYQVVKALFKAVENWAKSKGMDTIHGPLGFNDLEREGLLIEGFDAISTFEMQYSFPYYQKHIEKLGYKKEVDWLESIITVPDKVDERNSKLSSAVAKRGGFREVTGLSRDQIIKRYAHQILDVVDEAYGDLYGTVPLTERVRGDLIKQFKLILDRDFISLLVDKNDKVVGFGLGFPSLGAAVQKTRGRLLPFGWVTVLKAIKHPTTVDLGLICVKKDLAGKGLTSIIFNNMLTRFIQRGITTAETNAQLEDNYKVQQLFSKVYETTPKSRRRCYVKPLK